MADPKSFVALNIGSQRLSMAVFSATPEGGLLLKKYDSSELLADPAADASRVQQTGVAVNELVEKLGVAKQSVRYSISGQSVFSRFVKLPPLTEEKVDQIVEFEAQQNVPFPINEVVWDYQLVGSEEDIEMETLLVAIKSDALNEINDAVTASSLRTATVDVAPMALYNAFRYNHSALTQSAILIDIGARTTNLLYIEGAKVFARSIPVGGSTITSAIAKEFDISFAEAEEKKVANGFVALGGAYADHDDPEIAAMSKIIRNTLTRLHSEIVRTNNFYRSQQGGNLPTVAYLCGASVSMPYILDFFTEKLNLPVEFFNPLKNVLVDADADAERLGKEAHMMGELVGMGLRGLSSCPMELDLVPETVQKARELDARKPFFVTAGLGVLALMAAAGFHFHRGSVLAEEQSAVVGADTATLGNFDDQIKDWENIQKQVDVKTEPFTDAVFGRIFWLSLFKDLNSRLGNDSLWITSLEPYSQGKPVTSELFGGLGTSFERDEEDEDEDKGKKEKDLIDEILVKGLYREDAGSDVVYAFFNRLKDSRYFELNEVEQSDVLQVDQGARGERWAWTFTLRLPFPETTRIPFKR